MDIEKIKSLVKVNQSTGCWEWQNSCTSAGYGQLRENKIYWLAHRYAYACSKPLAATDVVRHKCHNTRCCNPEHLETGTHKDNWEDSRELHLATSAKRRKKWIVNGVRYGTIREASAGTGLSQGALTKHTVEGVFNIDSYVKACSIARVTPIRFESFTEHQPHQQQTNSV